MLRYENIRFWSFIGHVSFWLVHGAAADLPFTPDPQVQAQIDEISHSVGGRMLVERLEKLQLKFRGQPLQLVPELAYYSSRGTDVNEAMVAVFVARHLDIDANEIVRALAPYVGNDDTRFRNLARDWILESDQGLQKRQEGTQYLRGLIQASARRNEPVDPALAEFMFGKNPSAAIHDFVGAYLTHEGETANKIIWADHLIHDALWRLEHRFSTEFAEILPRVSEELSWLAAHDQWWVRLYAASIIRPHPQLGSEAIITKLRQDPNEAVRKAMTATARE